MEFLPFRAARERFLHLVIDDKFIDAARGVFEEAAPGAHDFLVIGPARRPKHLKSFTPARLDLDDALQPRFTSLLPQYAAVFVHHLTEEARLLVATAPRSARFVWLGWGADYYHLLQSRDALLLPDTRALVAGLPREDSANPAPLSHLTGLARAVRHPLAAARRFRRRRLLRAVGPRTHGEIALLNRFCAMAMPIEEDYAALRAQQPVLRVPFVDWNYWTEGFHADAGPSAPTGDDILLGNSATEANNHLEALRLLKDVLPPGRRVVCPLSYGDRGYGDAVEAAGRALLGEQFVPLRQYMAPAAYARIVGSCSIVVMNHLRQQALGNIVLALCAGAHVFLHPANPIHATMQRLGVPVNAPVDLADFLRAGEPALTPGQLSDVRARIDARYGRRSIVGRTRSLLERLRVGDLAAPPEVTT